MALVADYGSSTVHGVRRIENCTDCTLGSLGFSNGTFLRFGGELGPVASGIGGMLLNIGYQRYLGTSGVTQEIRVGFTWSIL